MEIVKFKKVIVLYICFKNKLNKNFYNYKEMELGVKNFQLRKDKIQMFLQVKIYNLKIDYFKYL